MKQRFDLQRPYSGGLTLTLKPGMAWLIYTDRGPVGPCGQSMSTTCDHSVFAVFESEDQLREYVQSWVRHGKAWNLQYGVIGEWSTGNGAVVVQRKEGE